jgi:hypothetical protein
MESPIGVVYDAKATTEKATLPKELYALQLKFSTGVRFTELKSIARVLAMLAQLPPPSRATNRRWSKLMKWYGKHWDELVPFLPSVQLRDENEVPIDGRREFTEKKLLPNIPNG